MRYVDPDLTGRMMQYVTLHVLWHHRRMCEFLELQQARKWKYLPEPPAPEIGSASWGSAHMGPAATKALLPLGYQLRGWSRSQHRIDGIDVLRRHGWPRAISRRDRHPRLRPAPDGRDGAAS